jgi:hypothetical protein
VQRLPGLRLPAGGRGAQAGTLGKQYRARCAAPRQPQSIETGNWSYNTQCNCGSSKSPGGQYSARRAAPRQPQTLAQAIGARTRNVIVARVGTLGGRNCYCLVFTFSAQGRDPQERDLLVSPALPLWGKCLFWRALLASPLGPPFGGSGIQPQCVISHSTPPDWIPGYLFAPSPLWVTCSDCAFCTSRSISMPSALDCKPTVGHLLCSICLCPRH